MSEHISEIELLVQGFAKHIKALKSAETKEASVRQNYIDPFWRALGWDVGDSKQLGPSEAEVIIEKNIETVDSCGLRNRRPDYLFRLGGFPRFIVEAKKPVMDIDDDKDAIFQAKQYAWNSTIPFAILTDFEQFRLYDATLMPIFDEPHRGLVKEFSIDYENYISQWDVLNATFGRNAVEGGSLENLLSRIKKIKAGRRIRTVDRMLIDLKGCEPVDRAFLAYLDTHRQHFAAEIYCHNKSSFPEADTHHGAARLTEAVQRLMDRLVFMRVCEDRDIIAFGSLRATLDRVGAEGGEFYESLTAMFRDMDARYNGYLYKPHFSETLRIDGNILADFTRTLYPPDGPWDFAAIGDDILGIVYERFLGNVVTVNNSRATIEEKPEVRHAGGVYYTPRFIVDTIIRRVVGPKLKGKTPAEVLDVKILDPACGSGSFLVAALQYLFDYCLDAIVKNPSLAKANVPALAVQAGKKGRKKKAEIAFQDSQGCWYLAPDFRAALLTNCIHGVDIDQQAVEVTVMSLYLKMLESKLPENWATLWVERQLLPPLDNNIQCGNSLIDESDWYTYNEILGRNQQTMDFAKEDMDTAFRMNRFDWTSRTRGFGRLLDKQAIEERGYAGFDCIIGNPPYIRVQELNKWAPEECEFYKWRFKSAAKGNYDIYVVFTEKALSLLAPDGLLGFIMPHKFWQAKYGEGLRKVIADGRNLNALVDFTHNTVFRDASIYTAIHIFSKAENKSGRVAVIRINTLIDGQAQLGASECGTATEGVEIFSSIHPAGSTAWSIIPPAQASTMARLTEATDILLCDITARMAQGIRTSMNSVYVLNYVGKHRNRYISEHLGKEVELETDCLLTFLAAEHMRRYEVTPTPQVVLVPYYTSGDHSGKIIPAKVMEECYPATWAYLKACEKELRQREDGKMDCHEWYGYVYPKNLGVMRKPKILVPDIVQIPSFSLDSKGAFAFVSGYAITLQPKYINQMSLILGILNSNPIGKFLKAVSTPLRGGWYRPFPQFMAQIPIKLPTTSGEEKLAERISESVGLILDAKAKLRPFIPGVKSPSLSDRETHSLQAEIEANEKRIDEAVFQLYGIDELPDK